MNEQKSTETKDENSDLLSSRQASQNNSQYELPIAYRSTEEYCTDTVNIVEVLTPTIDTSVTLSVSLHSEFVQSPYTERVYVSAKNITNCRRHKIIMDWIDISPDRSQAIWYCEKCGFTSSEYNKK